MIDAMKQVIQLLGPTAPDCCGCEYAWNEAIKVLQAAVEQAEEQEPVAWYCCVPGQDPCLLLEEPADSRYPPGYKEPLYTRSKS